MKKVLFLLAVLLITATTFAQVTVTILSVETITKGKQKGDSITYMISAPNTVVDGVGFEVVFDNGEINGPGGVYNPNYFSNRTATAYHFIGLRPSYLNMDRTYTITVITEEGTFYSDPYTVTAK